MEKAVGYSKTIPAHWTAKKKNHEWPLVVVGSAVGFAIIFALITLLELSAAK
jgi:hypothetical protein